MSRGSSQAAERLRELHHAPGPLLLPNAWDATTARAVVAAGFAVVATTSAGVARSLGYEDGESAPVDEMLAALARIAAAVDVPVTADVESGYGLSASELVERVVAAGAVGVNVEDTDHRGGGRRLVDATAQVERLAAIRGAAERLGVDLVVNARVDVFLLEDGAPGDRVDEAIRRGRLYVAAGADCVYPIGLADEAGIAALVAGVAAPVNVLLTPAAPPVPRLAELGVRRISLGSGLERAAVREVRVMLAALAGGDAGPILAGR